MSDIEVLTAARSPLKQLNDSTMNSLQSSPRKELEPSEDEKMTTENLMESPVKREDNTSRTFEEIRQLIDSTLFTKICEAVHQDKSTNTLEDEVEEVMEGVLPQFYPKEVVNFKSQGTSQSGTIHSTEKRGALRFYYLTVDGTKLPNKMDASSIRRKYSPSEKDVRILLENITEKEPGKVWQVKENVRKEFNVKDKYASIFCTPKNKKGPTTTGRAEEVASSSEDENPSNVRRLSSGFAAAGSKKNAAPKEAKKTKEKPKKEKEEKVTKAKGKGKEKVEKEKKTRKPREKKEKDKGMDKFVNKRNSTDGPGSTSATPFMSPQKRGERRVIQANQKLNDTWKKKDYPEFLKAAAHAAKTLSGALIDTISNDLFRIAVKKIFETEKDKSHLKKLNKEKKKEYRENVMAKRKIAYKRVDAKIKAHFTGKEIAEDLTISEAALPCPGRPIILPDNRMVHFSNCMQMVQFLGSLRQFVDVEEITTAENVCNGIHEGRPGYYKHTVKVILPLVKTLLQDVEYKLHTHFDARLREFNIQECNVSELCRALLIGKTKKDKSGKVLSSAYHADNEDDSDDDDKVSIKSGYNGKTEGSAAGSTNGSIKDGSAGPEEAKEPKKEVTENGENHIKDEPMEDGEEREKSNEISQEEMGEVEQLLSKFTANSEIWQLEPAVQMELMRILFYRVLELESCRDFLTEDIVSDEAASLKSRVIKHQTQLEEWRETLAKLPEYDENVDASTLSRNQTRERAEVARKRDNLEKKIEDCEDKLEELIDKIQTEKMLQAQSKRLSCIGEDRHCRRYYWVPHKSADAGVWIQNFGTTNFEKFVKECVEEGVNLEEDFETPAENAAKPIKRCQNENVYEQENWYRVEDIGALKTFTSSLSNGVRERKLKNFLTNNMDLIMKAIRHGSQDNSQSATPEGKPEEEEEAKDVVISEEPLDYLITTVVNLYSDMRDGYLTQLDPADFEPKLVSCQTLDAVKDCIIQLVDTINPANITVKLTQKESRETGSYSWFVLDKWKVRLNSCQNASAVHLLLSFFESRIDWKNSVKDKRCSVCNSKRSPEAKMVCTGCELICHYYCCRPRFLEKPSTWTCAACNRKDVLQARAAKSRPKYVETDTEDEEEEEEEEVEEDGQDETVEEAEQSQDSVDSDVFAADSDEEKHTPMQVPGHSKKRRIIESDDDEEAQPLNDSGELGRSRSSRIAKRKKASEPLSEVKETMEKVKATRIYKTLQNVPHPRRTRGQNSFATLETIETSLPDYETYEGFVQDLRAFMDHAREYFENHNERKLDELDELLVSLELPEIQ